MAVDALLPDHRGHARLHANTVVVCAAEDSEQNVGRDNYATCEPFEVEAEYVVRLCFI